MQKKYLRLSLAIIVVLSVVAFAIYKFFIEVDTKPVQIVKEETDPIYVAVVGPMSGPHASVGKSFLQAINLYVDRINQKGGIGGRHILLDVYDDQNKKELAAKRAQEIVDKNRAVAVIGHHYSSCSSAGGKLYKQYGFPALTPASTNVAVTQDNDWYFRANFNDRLQGRFLANYVKKVLRKETVSIIHEDLPYGSYLADVFEKNAKQQGIEIKYKWGFKVDSPNMESRLKDIVFNKLRKKDDAGLLFISTHASEGNLILKYLKEAHIRNPVVGPDAFTSGAFQEGFEKYPKTKNNPGYYTDGMYVTTPLIFDTTNEKGQQFKKAYEARYGESPGWHAAFAYDSAMIITQAIAESDIRARSNTLPDDRKKLRDYLASLNTIDDAIEGATGYNYFDKNGDSQKPVYVGVYKGGNIVSALIQLQTIPNVDEVGDIESARKDEFVLMFDGRDMYKTNVVYTGIEIQEIKDMDFKKLTCTIDFYLWFRYQGFIDVEKVVFVNAETPIDLEKPVEAKQIDDLNYRLYRVEGTFKMDFLPNRYTFGQHLVGVGFRHPDLDRNNLIYVKDVLGMGINRGLSVLEQMRQSQVLSPVSGWKIVQVLFFQDIAKKNSLGDPDYLNVKKGIVEYSRFNVGILIAEDKFDLRLLLPKGYVLTSLGISVFMVLLIPFVSRMRLFQSFSKSLWFIQAGFSVLLLLSLEILVIDWAAETESSYYISIIMLAFDIFWWLLPALLLISGMERFVWSPLEERTNRVVPNIIRRFVILMIWVMVFFGVVAFVFDQRLTSLLATSGVIAMIVGLALQINIANIFSGIAINVERPFRIDDWVRIGTFPEGQVVDINWRTTRLRTRDATIISIPNSQASESLIENFSYPSDSYWKYITVHVDPSHEPDRVKKILLDAVLASKFVLKDPPPGSKFLGMTSDMTGESESWAANYLVSAHVRDYGLKFAHNEAVWLSIWSHLRRAGIRHVMERQETHMYFHGLVRKKEKYSQPLSVLHELDIFKPFSEEAKLYLSKRMQIRRFAPDELIVEQGDSGDSLFIILEGAVAVWVSLEDGNEIEVARMGAGNFFGEMALLTGEKRTASIVALAETTVYEITKHDIAPLLEREPEISKRISAILTERKIATESQKSVSQREKIDRNTLSAQIFNKIQSFFGFGK